MGIEAALIGGGLGLLGSSMMADSASSAAATSAAAQTEAARLAAEQAKFRPVGVTTRFGSSQFRFSPEGYLTSAGYTVSPELRAAQDRLLGLGAGYLAQTPEEVAQKYLASQMDLLAPSRERQLAELRNRSYQTGREGLSVGATGLRPGGGLGLKATNPEMEAYYNALAQQDAALAAQAEQAGRGQIGFGAGLFGMANELENIAQNPLTLGAGLGGQQAAYGARAGTALLTGGLDAAKTMQAANQLNPFASTISGLSRSPEFTRGLAGLFGNSSIPEYSVDPYGYGIGSGGMGTVDTSLYGGAYGPSIR